MNCEGTMKVWVMRSAPSSARKRPASKLGMATSVPPVKSTGSIISQVPFE